MIQATKTNNTNKSYSPLEKHNEPGIDFVVNTDDFCFDKTVREKNDNVAKPNVVIKLDDDTDMKNKGNIGESEDKCEEQQVTRRPRKKSAEEADLKIKRCH